MPVIIIIVLLLVANAVLVCSECKRKKDNKQQLCRLRQEKIDKGIPEDNIDENDLKDEIEPKQIYMWVLGIVISLDIWIIGAVVTHLWAEMFFADVSAEDNRKALFGDSFGAVNALVSAFAFAGMIVAFVLQRYELRLQRKELRDNRVEMTQQTEQFQAQNKNMERQRFEDIFYNMLNLQQKIVDGLRYDYYEEDISTVSTNGGDMNDGIHYIKREVLGRDVFRYLFNEADIIDINDSERTRLLGYRQYLTHAGVAMYDGTYEPSLFDHYFRHLYKIVHFVDSQNFGFDEKYQYVSFLRGTLSRYELVWLYYNALNPSFYKFKKLIERYSLLKALRSDLLTISKETMIYYDGLGIKKVDLQNNHFGYGDFAFYLTDNAEDSTKYYLTAFWNGKDISGGRDYLHSWKSFINDNASIDVVRE